MKMNKRKNSLMKLCYEKLVASHYYENTKYETAAADTEF